MKKVLVLSAAEFKRKSVMYPEKEIKGETGGDVTKWEHEHREWKYKSLLSDLCTQQTRHHGNHRCEDSCISGEMWRGQNCAS